MKAKSQLILSVFIIIAGFTAVFGLSNYLENNRLSLPESYADSDLDLQGKRLNGYAIGAEGLLADWYWMRSLQYIGGKIVKQGLDSVNLDDMTSMNPRLLYPLLDNATTLDPKLMAAYSYGATILPAIDPKQAIALTEKGIENNPDKWRLLQYLGYIYWRLKDYEKAAEAYERGSRIPGAPAFFRLMTARMKTESGSRDTAREIYSQMLAEAPDAQTRKTAELRLMELDSRDERDAINDVLSASRVNTGRCPAGWSEVIPMLRQVRLPRGKDFTIDASRNLVDPSGAPYFLDPKTCRAFLGSSTKLPKQ